jgi:hydrogenase maturation protein HypF
MIEVGGLSQGVGFRPFIYGLAQRFELAGSVRNRAGAVAIEIEGAPHAIESFVGHLKASNARHAILRCEMTAPRGELAFRIERSEATDPALTARVFVPSDIATCDVCVSELLDPNDRRHNHPFINCTQCGPRASIIRDMPYDRERTSMARFAMCSRCQAEHDDPDDRRFHAQPIACHDCGPKLRVLDAAGNMRSPLEVPDPIAHLADALINGQIAAVKGIGGFHLICDASSEQVIQRLRRRKGRPSKPFALMVASTAEAERWAVLDTSAREALCSEQRPIVLVDKRPGTELPESIAPHVGMLGLLLPYTALQHLLFRALEARGQRGPLVMTSGNRSGSLIAISDREALERLSGIADVYVTHDRAIELAYEDSVVRAAAGGAASGLATRTARCLPIRRARGYAPLPIELPIALDVPALAVGGHLKAVFALASAGERSNGVSHVVMSPCFGDLDGHDSYLAWTRAIGQLERMVRIAPARIVHDLHLDYASSRYAVQRAGRGVLERIAVQHHHAHMASCMLEHGLDGEVIGVCFDGTGLGYDGTLWGGEWLVGGYGHAARIAHLATMPLVGGDRAAREPWRIGLAYAIASGAERCERLLAERVEPRALRSITGIVRRALSNERSEVSASSALTSSMGRLFDAVSALLGVALVTTYEGEAAMQLEALAARAEGAALFESYPFEIIGSETFEIAARTLIRAIDRDLSTGEPLAAIARRFHNTVVTMIAETCARISERTGVTRVVLSGGVFANALVTGPALEALRARGLEAYAHERVPTNDGGLCLGQLAVAARVSAHAAVRPARDTALGGS